MKSRRNKFDQIGHRKPSQYGNANLIPIETKRIKPVKENESGRPAESGDELDGEEVKADVEQYSSFNIHDAASSMIRDIGLDEYNTQSKNRNNLNKKKKPKCIKTCKVDLSAGKSGTPNKVYHNVPFKYMQTSEMNGRSNTLIRFDESKNTVSNSGTNDRSNTLIRFDDSQNTKSNSETNGRSNSLLRFDQSISINKIKKNNNNYKKGNDTNYTNIKKQIKNKSLFCILNKIRKGNIIPQLELILKEDASKNLIRKCKRSLMFLEATKYRSNSTKKIKLSDLSEKRLISSPVDKDETVIVDVDHIQEKPGINITYTEKTFRKKLKCIWKGDSAVLEGFVPEGGHVLTSPYQCCHLPQFVTSEDRLLHRLAKQLRKLPMLEKSNDMYKFHQSAELPPTGACGEFRGLLLGPVRRWLIKVTGVPLNDKLAVAASLYRHTDALLCHDDELEGRRIAFILYLGEEEQRWRRRWGGSLDLFDVDSAGNPARVVRRLYPQHNSFAFFEVSPVSYHQVSEVLTRDSPRLSVSGWFHGPDIVRPPRPLPPLKHFTTAGHVEESILYSWISPLYLAESTQASIRRQFQRDSEIQLEDFIPEERYSELCQALGGLNSWAWAGPPNRAHYQVCTTAEVPPIVLEFLKVMRSEAAMLIMSQLTGLPLHPLYADDDESDNSSKDGSDTSSDGESEVGSYSGSSSGPLTLKALIKQQSQQGDAQAPNQKKKKKVDCLELPWIPDVGIMDSPPVGAEACTFGHVYSSVRRLTHGCYSLIMDDDNKQQQKQRMDNRNVLETKSSKRKRKVKDNSNGIASKESTDSFVLDTCLYCNVSESGWIETRGGSTSYMARDEEKELLTVTPRANSLALVYRDQHTYGFLKHINSTAGNDSYNSVVCQYK